MKRRLPVGVPSNYAELLKTYEESLTEAAKGLSVTVEELVESARQAKLIESFSVEEHYPERFTWDEACAVVGMDDAQWNVFLKNTKKPPKGSRLDWASVRPYALSSEEGSGPAPTWDMSAIYWGSDILRVTDFLDANGLKRGRSSCPALADAFAILLYEFYENTRRAKLNASSKRFSATLAEMEEGLEAAWPEDLPRNDRELSKMYQEYIFNQVRRVSKIKTEDELDEVMQQVWLGLLTGRVLDRFVEAAKTRLPRTLTTVEAQGYLGISARQWASAVAFSKKSDSFWLPLPVKGTHLSEDALYLTEDIQTLDTSGFLEGQRNEPRQHPEFSGRGFRSYLTQAVRNHFKNMLRTRSRRHKERVVEANAVLTPSSSGGYHRGYTSEEDVNWEENLADRDNLSMEDMIDLKAALVRQGVNPLTETGMNVLDHMTRGLTAKSAVKYEERQGMRMAG